MSTNSRTEIAAAIVQLLSEAKSQKSAVRSVAAFLLEQRRTRDLDAILRDVVKLREDHGLHEATVTSAFSLKDDMRQQIVSLVRKQHGDKARILLDENLDPGLIGGLQLETGGKQLDVSIRSKIMKLKSSVA